MTTPSLYETVGLSVNFWQPTVAFTSGSSNTVTVTPKGSHQLELTDSYTALSFVKKAVGGYWSARIDTTDDRLAMEWWLQNGVGMYVEIADPGANVVWAGFVNGLSLNLAGLAITKGPLLDAGNRVVISYSPVDTVPEEPTLGTRTNTTVGENDDSQRKYGILYAYLSTGGITDAEADQLRDLFLSENANPKLSRTADLSGTAGDSIVSLDCAGYVQMFSQWPYNQTATTGLINLSAKIEDVLDADPNSIFSAANSNVTANTIQVVAWETKDRDAWAVLRGLVDLGDTALNRYTFKVGANQLVTYAAAPSVIEYHQYLTDPRQEVTTVSGGRIRPWDVEPGKWVLNPDLLIGSLPATNLRDDPRAMYVDQTTFTAPWGIALQGGDADRIEQVIARLGLDGVAI